MTYRNLALVGWIVLYLVAVELALEVRAHHRGWDTLLFGPVLRVSSSQDEAGEASSAPFGPFDDFPFRSPRIELARREDIRRIWIASASHAEDIHLPAEFVFPNQLARREAEAGAPSQVLNASRAGIGIAGNTLTLGEFAPIWQPDVALLYQASLDISRLAEADEGGWDGPAMTPNAEAPDVSWVIRTFESTTTYALLKGTLTAQLGMQRVLSDRMSNRAIAAFEDLVRAFVDEARAQGVQPVLSTFATSHTRNDLGSIPEQTVIDIFQFTRSLSMAGWMDAIERCNATVARIAEEEQIPLVDIAGTLSGRTEYFRDFVHFTPEGHEVIAETIQAELDRIWSMTRDEGAK